MKTFTNLFTLELSENKVKIDTCLDLKIKNQIIIFTYFLDSRQLKTSTSLQLANMVSLITDRFRKIITQLISIQSSAKILLQN